MCAKKGLPRKQALIVCQQSAQMQAMRPCGLCKPYTSAAACSGGPGARRAELASQGAGPLEECASHSSKMSSMPAARALPRRACASTEAPPPCRGDSLCLLAQASPGHTGSLDIQRDSNADLDRSLSALSRQSSLAGTAVQCEPQASQHGNTRNARATGRAVPAQGGHVGDGETAEDARDYITRAAALATSAKSNAAALAGLLCPGACVQRCVCLP
jgi:hypothetical protein